MALSIDIDEPADEKKHEEEESHNKQAIPETEDPAEDRKESLLMDANLSEKIPEAIVDNHHQGSSDKKEEDSPNYLKDQNIHSVIEEADEERE